MNKFAVCLLSITLIMSVILFLQKKTETTHQKLTVVCTTTLLADALKILGQDNITVICLMNPGVDPHLYKPTERDMHHLAEADLIIYHGLHLEGKMAELFKHMSSYRPAVAACQSLTKEDLITTEHETIVDPHVWFSIPLWIQVIQHIADTLAQHDSLNAKNYEERSLRYTHRLRMLHNELQKTFNKIPPHKRILITAHDAFGYFGQTYDFTVLGLQGISTDADISAGSVAHLAAFIAEHDIPAIFTEQSIPLKSIKALEQAVNRYQKKVVVGPELYTDSLGDESSPASTYESMMRYTSTVLVTFLQPKEQE